MDTIKENKRIIAVDFDGVIHEYSQGWWNGSIYDGPVNGALDALLKLKKNFDIIIFTTREDHGAIRQWIRIQAEIYLFNTEELNTLLELPITNKKPLAFAFIDDRAIRFTNWKDMLNYF